MIVRVTLKNGSVIMFGDSYKKWDVQFQEYCWFGAVAFNNFYIRDVVVEKVEYCKEKFPTYGGLKWSTEKALIDRLKEQAASEGRQPKDYSKYAYFPAPDRMMDKINECIKDGWRLAYANNINAVMPNA